jgi:Tol biopolymer transport system component
MLNGQPLEAGACSPNGRYLAALHRPDNNDLPTLYVIDVLDSTIRTLPATLQFPILQFMSVSNDGRVVTTVSVTSVDSRVFVLRDTIEGRELIPGVQFDLKAQIAPDGAALMLYSHRNSVTRIEMIDLERTERQTLFLHAREPAWLSDGSAIVYASSSSRGDIRLYDLRTRRSHRLTDFINYSSVEPAWSPDGQYIAHVSRAGDIPAIFLNRLPDDERRQLTFDGATSPCFLAARPAALIPSGER